MVLYWGDWTPRSLNAPSLHPSSSRYAEAELFWIVCGFCLFIRVVFCFCFAIYRDHPFTRGPISFRLLLPQNSCPSTISRYHQFFSLLFFFHLISEQRNLCLCFKKNQKQQKHLLLLSTPVSILFFLLSKGKSTINFNFAMTCSLLNLLSPGFHPSTLYCPHRE